MKVLQDFCSNKVTVLAQIQSTLMSHQIHSLPMPPTGLTLTRSHWPPKHILRKVFQCCNYWSTGQCSMCSISIISRGKLPSYFYLKSLNKKIKCYTRNCDALLTPRWFADCFRGTAAALAVREPACVPTSRSATYMLRWSTWSGECKPNRGHWQWMALVWH